MPSVLLIDDQQEESKALSAALRQNGYEVHAHENGNAPAINGESDEFDVVVSKLHLKDQGTGIRFIQSWRRDRPQIPVIAIAGEEDLDDAVEAMRIGADDCLTQPVHPDKLAESLRRVLSICRNERQPGATKDEGQWESEFGMVGASPPMRNVLYQAERVAPTSSTVLLTAGTGAGKDLLASAIHRLSNRRDRPFVAINVAAVPNTLIESELFGHVKGAFTDAAADRVGRFEAASGGTLFIDEIGDLELQSQAKLLRVLESRLINRVGCNADIAIDVRVIAATSRNLEQLVSKGKFREDLYYRLNVIRIELPDLRDRREDIPLLVNHFLASIARQQQQSPHTVSPELLEFLQQHPWPGHIRQLKNCLESMVVMAESHVLTIDDLPKTFNRLGRPNRAIRLPLAGHALVDLEQQAIEQTLELTDGHRNRAAEILGISVRTLQRKLKQWKTVETGN